MGVDEKLKNWNKPRLKFIKTLGLGEVVTKCSNMIQHGGKLHEVRGENTTPLPRLRLIYYFVFV